MGTDENVVDDFDDDLDIEAIEEQLRKEREMQRQNESSRMNDRSLDERRDNLPPPPSNDNRDAPGGQQDQGNRN